MPKRRILIIDDGIAFPQMVKYYLEAAAAAIERWLGREGT